MGTDKGVNLGGTGEEPEGATGQESTREKPQRLRDRVLSRVRNSIESRIDTVVSGAVDRVKDSIKDRIVRMRRREEFPYSVDDVPEGAQGIEWLIDHREEVFPWVESEIQFDNGGAPSGSQFYFSGARDYQERAAHLGYGHFHETQEKIARARGAAAELLGCTEDEVAFVQNTAAGVNIVAQGIEWQEGDEVIVARGDQEYPTNFLPWKQLESKGVVVREIGDENGFISPEDVRAALSSKTRLVALSSVGWKNGQRIDLEAIGGLIQSHNTSDPQKNGKPAQFFVDAIQSLGAHPIDVKDWGIDYLASGSSKWLLADNGNGIFLLFLRSDSRFAEFSARCL